MDPRKKKTFWQILLFILGSLLLHALLFAPLAILSLWNILNRSPLIPEEAQKSEVLWVNPQPTLPTQASIPPAGELVDIAKPKEEKVPEKARYISQYNSSVKEETVAKKIPKKAKINTEISEENGNQGSPEKGAPIASKPKAIQEPAKNPSSEKPAERSVSDLRYEDLKLKPTDLSDWMPKDEKKVAMKENEKTSRNFNPDLSPKVGLPGRGDEFVHDFMPNLKIGDKTYLNAMAFPDVQYFTRLKRIFRMRFNPAPPLRSYFAGNRVITGSVNVTMAVTVSAKGQLQDLFIVQSSGIPAYDEEALRTVRESSPFSAVPDKILDKDGVLRMTWSFVTYL